MATLRLTYGLLGTLLVSGLSAHAQPSPVEPAPSFTPTPEPLPSGNSRTQSATVSAASSSAFQLFGYETEDSYDDCVLKGNSIPCAIYLPTPFSTDKVLTLTSPDDRISFIGFSAADQEIRYSSKRA